MANYITDDTCEDVTICDPNVIVQDCLPEGDDLVCLYTIDLQVPWKAYYAFAPWNNADQYGDYYYQYENVEFLLDKVVKTGENGIQQEVWLAHFEGGYGNDWISGKGLLEYIRDTSGAAVAQVYPSVYLGDLIHFDLDGGEGNDWIQGANNADILTGGEGIDTFKGEGGDDNIAGNAGVDNLYGGDGNDYIDGGTGSDYVRGGDGDDEIIGGDEILGGDALYGEDGNDNLTGGLGDDYLNGGADNDWMSGGEGNDTIEGEGGDDCADGGDGDDQMYMGSGDDRALGGAGDDYMRGGDGDDRLDGGDGNDTVKGDDGNDLLDGGAGDDLIKGGDGNDIIRGGLGDDEVWGGAGCDIFAFCEVSFGCRDVIEDFSAGRDPDQIDFSHLEGIDNIRVEMTGFNDMVRLDLLADGEAVQQILVASDEGANLASVFDKDTAYGGDDGALVKLAGGMMVDLPTTSVMVADDGLFF
jgi:Ca2+-binding RTX toxin-like protein